MKNILGGGANLQNFKNIGPAVDWKYYCGSKGRKPLGYNLNWFQLGFHEFSAEFAPIFSFSKYLASFAPFELSKNFFNSLKWPLKPLISFSTIWNFLSVLQAFSKIDFFYSLSSQTWKSFLPPWFLLRRIGWRKKGGRRGVVVLEKKRDWRGEGGGAAPRWSQINGGKSEVGKG